MFRRYDSTAGRWLSPDPLGWGAADPGTPQSLNRYAYVRNNPLSLTDSLGLDDTCVSGDDDGSDDGDDCSSPDNGIGTGMDDGDGSSDGWYASDGLDDGYGYYADPVLHPPSDRALDTGSPCDGPNDPACQMIQCAADALCWIQYVYINPLLPPIPIQISAPSNPTQQQQKQQKQKANLKCAAATASSGALFVTAGLNEVGALTTGEVSPFAMIFHGIAIGEGIAGGAMGIYAGFVCYQATQF